jgi:hypothetical protein
MNKKEKRLLRLTNAWADLFYAEQAYRMICTCPIEDMNYHFLLSMVTCYCRTFTENSGLGDLWDEYEDYPDFDDAEMNARHDCMMDLRNKFFAHSSTEGIKIEIIPPNIANPPKTNRAGYLGFQHRKEEFQLEPLQGFY